MLRTLPSLDAIRREIRRRVCGRCYRRPRHSESLGPEVVRPCELSCPAFVYLRLLRRTAVSREPMIRSREEAVRQKIDQLVVATAAVAPDMSPLIRYREQIVTAVADLVDDI